MAKKIRLIDDEIDNEESNTESSSMSTADAEKLMKYAEAIDWKLWEILKLLRSNLPTEDK